MLMPSAKLSLKVLSLFGFVALCWSEWPEPRIASGTTVVVFRTPTVAVLSADSGVFSQQGRGHNECKIAQFGKVFIGHAGIIRDKLGYDLVADVSEAVRKGGSLKEIADRWQESSIDPLTRAMTWVWKHDPSYFAKYFQEKDSPDVAFVTFEDNEPAFAERDFTTSVMNGKLEVLPREPQDCPGKCPISAVVERTLGYNDTADQLVASTEFRKANSLVEASYKMIKSEADAHPDAVAEPISILIIDKSGAHWAPGHQGVCPDIAP